VRESAYVSRTPLRNSSHYELQFSEGWKRGGNEKLIKKGKKILYAYNIYYVIIIII